MKRTIRRSANPPASLAPVVVVTVCPLLAAHLSGLHPAAQTAPPSGPAAQPAQVDHLRGLEYLDPRDAPLILRDPEAGASQPAVYYVGGRGLHDYTIWDRAVKLGADLALCTPSDDDKLWSLLNRHLRSAAEPTFSPTASDDPAGAA